MIECFVPQARPPIALIASVAIIAGCWAGYGHFQTKPKYNEAEALFEKGLQAMIRKDYVEAESTWRKALIVTAKNQDGQYRVTMSWLAYLLQLRGKYAESEYLYNSELKSQIDARGGKDFGTACDMGHLADLYRCEKRFHDADVLYLRALSVSRAAYSRNNVTPAFFLTALADSYQEQGRIHEAIPLYEEALQIRQKIFGLDNKYTAFSINRLANAYRAVGRASDVTSLIQ